MTEHATGQSKSQFNIFTRGEQTGKSYVFLTLIYVCTQHYVKGNNNPKNQDNISFLFLISLIKGMHAALKQLINPGAFK